MYSVSLLIKNSQVALMFNFKSFKAADDLFKKVRALVSTAQTFDLEDDYEMRSTVDMSTVAAVSFSEYVKEMIKNGQIQILQAKSDLQTQTLAKNDIGLRMLGDAANRADTIPGEHKIVKVS